MSAERVIVGIEVGGTKVVVGASRGGPGLVSRLTVPTTGAQSTLESVREVLVGLSESYDVAAVGIGSFGPIDVRRASPDHGHMLDTPKPGWSGVDVLGGLSLPGIPTVIDTDVNAAVTGERMWGAGTADHVAYITVGTGIGGAIWSGGGLVHGMNHSEVGHVRVPRHRLDTFSGVCPFHGDCLEGMASGTALRERWGAPAEDLAGDSLVNEMEAWYLAHGVATMGAVVPVEQVIIGGGVGKMPGIHRAVSVFLADAAGRYPALPFASGGPDILPPGLGDDAGVVGAIELARSR